MNVKAARGRAPGRPLCATDKVMFAYQHGRLCREHTIASGDAMCDYWVVGDRVKEPR